MSALRTLQDLSNYELFDLARLFASEAQPLQPHVILDVAAELRRRGLVATEDYLLRLVAKFIH